MTESPELKLNQQIKCNYRSFTGPPPLSRSSENGCTCDLDHNYNVSNLPKEVLLQQLASGSPEFPDQNPQTGLKEKNKDCCSTASLTPIYAASIIFALLVATALILHIYLMPSLVFVRGVLVSDHELCTGLGQRVLHDRGSSVDAAISAALCLSVVHPHVSGVGGGGVMMVHDIQKNKTRVIDYQVSAPTRPVEEMLNYSHFKAGLEVGVPGMLRGLHRAHSLYGRLSWEDVVTRAATVAKEGFNVSLSLAEAILKVKGEKLSKHFRDVFFPAGMALSSGSFLRLPGLAKVLQAPLSDFYSGNFSQEIEEEVRANGGVLSREDISNSSVLVEPPVQTLLNDSIIQVPPSAALVSGLNLLEGHHFNENNNSDNQEHHRTTETHLAGRVVVMGSDDLLVSVTSSLSGTFGSRIMTQSGIILNSAILNLSRENKTRGQPSTNQKNRVQPGKRASSWSLMPTIVVPAWSKCGVYMAFSSLSGKQSLSMITQVMSSEMAFHRNDSTNVRRLQDQLQPDRDVYFEFPGERAQFFQGKGHKDLKAEKNPEVLGIMRKKDIIMPLKLP